MSVNIPDMDPVGVEKVDFFPEKKVGFWDTMCLNDATR